MENRVRLPIVVVMIVGLAIAGETFYLLKQDQDIRYLNFQHAGLLARMNVLETDHSSLQGNYAVLSSDYQLLENEYLSLETAHNTLNTSYSRIQDEYENSETELSDLKSAYSELLKRAARTLEAYSLLDLFVDRPLTSKTIPSLSDLQAWLSLDETDSLAYHADFDCKDFATLLAIKARTQHFDMGVVAIKGWNSNTFEDFGHAFNAIITTDGLVYIEPQTDVVWWYTDHGEIAEDTVYELDEGWIYIEGVDVIIEY